MIHPSYVELMKVVNQDAEVGVEPVVNSRYSIVIATAKRARQLIKGDDPLIYGADFDKPLSTAVQELYTGKIHIMPEDAEEVPADMAEDTAAESAPEESTERTETDTTDAGEE